jgi:hypothetical protein
MRLFGSSASAELTEKKNSRKQNVNTRAILKTIALKAEFSFSFSSLFTSNPELSPAKEQI